MGGDAGSRGRREKGSGTVIDSWTPSPYPRAMARPPRAAEGGLIYHALNRANARLRIFDEDADYDAFDPVLAERAERGRWGSLWRSVGGESPAAGPALSAWPIARPADWVERVNAPLSAAEQAAMERGIGRGQPLGSPEWQAETAARLGLESC